MIKPEGLKRGDKVAIVSLSRGMLGEDLFIHKYTLARERMEKLYGLETVAMPNALKGIDYLYRHPEARAADLLEAFRNPEIKAVFNAIGGDDTIRLLPYIDFQVLHDHPKIFTGFSDTTTNHFMLHKAGVVSYYGLSVMNQWAEYVEINPYTRDAMEMLFHPAPERDIPCSDFCSYDCDKVWWGEEHMAEATPRYPNTGYEILQGQGRAEGELLGGCVDVFPELLGTPLWPTVEEWRGKLLLLETSEENMAPELLTAILRNLQAQGILQVLQGIVVGKPAFQERAEDYRAVYRQVVGQEAGLRDLPILWNVNIGHAYPTGILPLGLRYEINCEKKTFRLLQSAVS